MNLIYFGSSEFSRVVLEGLCRMGFAPSLVVTKPDKPKGRGLQLTATEVSVLAESKKISVVKPNSLKEKSFIEKLRAESVDFFVVVDYGKIIPLEVLSLPNEFTLGLHPSLLPRYRGPAPIEYALLNGDQTTGLTIFKVNEKVDSGDIILQKQVVIDSNDDYHSLSRKLSNEGFQFIVEGLSKIKDGSYKLVKQAEARASFTFKFKKIDGQINWQKRAVDINNLVRAISGWPSAYTYHNGLLLKVIKSDVIKVTDEIGPPGGIVKIEPKGIYVTTGEDILRISRIQPQGKKVMDAWSFVCGHHLKVGMSF
ncbi:MAG: methionyl-tRNA formyltransferase [Candidatus Omnitrophica bacterium]|nr:methionyl-tRNA formyltransferase [Candidatus Omnitrophota bacterium]